jgi:dolichol-phosphate mannosyltransferase
MPPAAAGVAAASTHARSLVVVATYNERGNLAGLLERIWGSADVDVLVVDDSSPDGTGDFAESLARTEPRLTVLHRPEKAGLAGAQLLGFEHGIRRGYRCVIQMDADLSHPPEALPAVLRASLDADVVVGSRRVRGGRIEGRSAWRNVLTRAACFYTRALLRIPVRDCTAGFRCMRVAALRRVDPELVRCKGYGFIIETNFALSVTGARFAEVPIVFVDREAGGSKLTLGILLEALAVVLRLRLGFIAPAVSPAVPAPPVYETRPAP